jgi:hypothetical protein
MPATDKTLISSEECVANLHAQFRASRFLVAGIVVTFAMVLCNGGWLWQFAIIMHFQIQSLDPVATDYDAVVPRRVRFVCTV